MSKQFFKRSLRKRLMIASLIANFVISTIQIISKGGIDGLTPGIFYTLTTVAIIVLVLIVNRFIPPDFKYYVRLKGDYIIFEFSATDKRPILRNYHEVNKDYYHIVIQDDRDTTIPLPYDEKVLKFLKQVRI